MAKRSLTERVKDAYRSLTRPDIGRDLAPVWNYSNWAYNSAVDYRHEVGNLELNSLVMAVVNYTASRIPEAVPTVCRKKKDGNKDYEPDHPMAQLIRRPNRHHIWANYADACSVSWWISGNVYFYKVRDGAGNVVELWYLPHFLVEPRYPGDGRSPEVPFDANNDSFVSHYQYTCPDKAPVLYPAQDMIHLKKGKDLNRPHLGKETFAPLFKELYGDESMALFTASIMKNMGIQVPIFSPKDDSVKIDEIQARAMIETWKAKTTGGRAGEPVVQTIPVDIEKFGFSPTELDLSNLRLIPESRVAAVTGIPAATLQFMVGLQNGTSYASSEQARQQGYEEVIIPIQRIWAEELNWQLLSEFDDKGAQFEFDTSNVRVLQEDRDALFAREINAFRSGVTTIDECLIELGKKPYNNETGKIRFIPSTSQPTNEEQLIAKSDGSLRPEPVDPSAQEAQQAADIEKMFADLERQMKGFHADVN